MPHFSFSIDDKDRSALAEMIRAVNQVYKASAQHGYSVAEARSLPERYAKRAHDILQNAKLTDVEEDRTLKATLEIAKDMLRMKGHAAAAARIAETASAVHNLRDILPQIGARLAIEAGTLARNLDAEAENHRESSR